MYWTIGSFPELHHLEPHERAEVMKRAPWWMYLVIIGRPLLFGLVMGMIVSAAAAALISREAALPAFFIAFIVLGVAGYAYEMHQLRQALRRTIIEAFRGQRLPFCIMCGYDLRAATGGTCPECGAGVMVKRQSFER